MALTLDRWIAAAIAGCLIAMVIASAGDDGLGSTRRRAPATREILQAQVYRSASSASRASTRLNRRRLIDSVNAALARTPAVKSARLLVASNNPRQAQLTRAVNARLAGALPLQTVTEVNLVARADTNRNWSRQWNLHLLPSATSRRCVGISGNPRSEVRGVAEWIGPCGFYALYGAPGASIDRWLQSGAWMYGARFQTSVSRPQDYSSYYGWRNRRLWREAAGFPVREFMGTLAYSCLAGNRDACSASVLNPRDNDQGSDWSSYRALGNLTYMADGTIWMASNNYGFFGFLLGPSMRSLLSDMAVSLGPDRFRQFWTSPLPPDEAFRAAAGQDIGDWIGSWMRSAYPGSFGRGARIPALTVVFALGLVILALGSASVAWRRRQVA